MRAEEVCLPFSPENQPGESSQSSNDGALPQHPPKAITAEELDRLLSTEKVTEINGVRFIGNLPVDPADVPQRFCCRCRRFDLTSEKDRNEYGDLVARTSNPNTTIEVLWEQRLQEQDKLVVYMTYTEFVRVADEQHSKESR